MARKVIILAAGKSTRMKSKTPKVLHSLLGAPLLEWVLDTVSALEPTETIVVTGHESDRVREAFADRQLTFVTQEPQNGTGHAVMMARDALDGFDGEVVVLCGDVPLLRPETLVQLANDAKDAGASILTTRMLDPTGYGRVLRSESDDVHSIVEQKDCTQEQRIIDEVNTGSYVFDCQSLLSCLDRLTTDNAQGEYYLTDVVGLLVQDGKRVAATFCEDPSETLGINTRQDLAEATAIASERELDRHMTNGVTIVDPASTWIERDVTIGRDTTIHPFSVIRRGVQVGEDNQIGPFAHLRSGTVTGEACKAGAFVETKNATFGDGTKAGHLAYLGDVTMGERVNIGAGSIVANYDGVNKHQTEIDDDAFIGCGTVLVAPVKVNKRGQTGANTVVPHGKDVPENTIVVGVPARELKKKD